MKSLSTRQKIRKTLIFTSAILFPITIFYFSPYIIIMASMDGIINGSALLFIALLLFSCFFGRLFCGYVCPGAGFGEMAGCINNKPAKLGKRRYIRYVIWVIWLALIIFFYIKSWPIKKVDPFLATKNGISVWTVEEYIPYYIVVFLLFNVPLLFGRRALCHYLCWMSPFMDIGMWLRRKLHLPGIHIKIDSKQCTNCKQCNHACPMGLDVAKMVEKEQIQESECSMCGACIDTCLKKVLRYSFRNK